MEATEPVDEFQTVISTAVSMVTNGTIVGPSRRFAILKTISTVNSTILLVIIMVMMGCTMDLNQLKQSFRRPVGFAIGMVSQFVLMPLISFCLALALQLETAGALALLIVGCSPGGTLSNIFTYWTDGDVSLSVGMTTVSSTVAIGMMPLNLFIYTRVWIDDGAVIPYTDIIVTLVTIIIPVLFGVVVRYFKEHWVVYIKKISSIIILVLIVLGYVTLFLLNPYFYKAEWGLWVAAVILPLVGYTIGYGFAFLLRQSHPKCRTIAFETGSQNIAIAFTLINVSFAGTDLYLGMIFFPTLYSLFIIIDSGLVVAAYRWYARRHTDAQSSELDVVPSGERRDVRDVVGVYVINADGGEKPPRNGVHNHHGNEMHGGVYTKHVEIDDEMEERNGGMVSTSSHGENENSCVNP